MAIAAPALDAAGLTIYSYRDDIGQTIIVDSLDKIPAQYRKQAQQDFIPSFRSPRPRKEENLTIIEAVPDPDSGRESGSLSSYSTGPGQNQRGSGETSGSAPEIIAPPGENFSAEIASATDFMTSLREIQHNAERMHAAANTFGVKHPVIHQLHQQNVLAMQRFDELRKFNWEAGKAWKSAALDLVERYKTQQYTISKWLRDGGQGLKKGLPAMLQANSLRLNQLEQTFKALQPK